MIHYKQNKKISAICYCNSHDLDYYQKMLVIQCVSHTKLLFSQNVIFITIKLSTRKNSINRRPSWLDFDCKVGCYKNYKYLQLVCWASKQQLTFNLFLIFIKLQKTVLDSKPKTRTGKVVLWQKPSTWLLRPRPTPSTRVISRPRLQESHLCHKLNVRKYTGEKANDVQLTTTSNGGLDQAVQLLISTDCQLKMAWSDSLHFQIFTGITSQLQNLSISVSTVLSKKNYRRFSLTEIPQKSRQKCGHWKRLTGVGGYEPLNQNRLCYHVMQLPLVGARQNNRLTKYCTFLNHETAEILNFSHLNN